VNPGRRWRSPGRGGARSWPRQGSPADRGERRQTQGRRGWQEARAGGLRRAARRGQTSLMRRARGRVARTARARGGKVRGGAARASARGRAGGGAGQRGKRGGRRASRSSRDQGAARLEGAVVEEDGDDRRRRGGDPARTLPARGVPSDGDGIRGRRGGVRRGWCRGGRAALGWASASGIEGAVAPIPIWIGGVRGESEWGCGWLGFGCPGE